MAPGRTVYEWTTLKRHVIHIGKVEFGLPWHISTNVFNHIFHSSFATSRIRDEWGQRKNPTRCSMWLDHIDKTHYSVKEMAERREARQLINAALQTLGFLSFTASTTTRPISTFFSPTTTTNSSFTNPLSSHQSTADSSYPIEKYDAMQFDRTNPYDDTPGKQTSPLKRKASLKSREDGQAKKMPKTVRFSDPSSPPVDDNNNRLQSDYSPRSKDATMEMDTQHESAKKDDMIKQLKDEIARLREENEDLQEPHDEMERLRDENDYFARKYREKVDEALSHYERSVAYHQRMEVAERLAGQVMKPKTTDPANQQLEIDQVSHILYQAMHMDAKLEKAKKQILRLQGELAYKNSVIKRVHKELRVFGEASAFRDEMDEDE